MVVAASSAWVTRWLINQLRLEFAPFASAIVAASASRYRDDACDDARRGVKRASRPRAPFSAVYGTARRRRLIELAAHFGSTSKSITKSGRYQRRLYLAPVGHARTFVR